MAAVSPSAGLCSPRVKPATQDGARPDPSPRTGGEPARRAVETAARDSYGRLVAFLSTRTRDVAAAEDALSEALLAALAAWPRDGVPRAPDAWLLTAARRRLVDRARHDRMRAEKAPELELL